MGYFLKFKESNLLLNPGQVIRGLLMLLLIVVFFYDLQKKIDQIGNYFLLLIAFLFLFVTSIYAKTGSLILLLDEFIYFSRILFILLLMCYVVKHKEFFIKNLDIIIIFNFIIFSLSLNVGYFSGAGLSTYSYVEKTSKGFFYGGNPVSLLCLIFFIYHLFNFRFKVKNILFIIISIFNIHIISTKATVAVPFIFFLFFINLLKESNFARKLISCFLLITVLFFGYFTIKPIVMELYENRYSKVINRAYGSYLKKERVLNSKIIAPLEMVANRRVMAAKQQSEYLFQNPQSILLGVGHTNQIKFWQTKNMTYHNASMDMFDTLFMYGILGTISIFAIILKTVYSIIIKIRTDRNAIIIFIIFLYSFFGGHVINALTSGTMMALFFGIECGKCKNNNRLFNKFRWLKH